MDTGLIIKTENTLKDEATGLYDANIQDLHQNNISTLNHEVYVVSDDIKVEDFVAEEPDYISDHYEEELELSPQKNERKASGEREDKKPHSAESDSVSTLDSDAEIIEGDLELYLHEDRTQEKENQGDDDSTQPSTSSSQPPSKKQCPSVAPWQVVDPEHSDRKMPEWKGQQFLPTASFMRPPVDYFRDFFDSKILDYIVEQSNLYALHKDLTKPLELDHSELEQFFGSLFLMSLMKITDTRLYWNNDFEFHGISKFFSRKRWRFIKTCLHCNNNDLMLPKNDPNYDPLFKVRPLLTHLQSKFKCIPMPQLLCVTEQVVPFKERSQLKQYIPSKPHKWGYKVFALCDNSGIQYDFEVYVGKIQPVEGTPNLGVGPNIALHLTKSIPEGFNHLLYFDNWFTSIPLISHLAKKNIFCLAHINRVTGISSSSVISDNELLRRGGSYIELSSVIDGVDLRVVKWADNQCINLVSSFSSACPMGTCKRYDKREKKIVEIPYPSIVQTYNSFLGGVNLMNALINLYRICVRSKKYYHKLIFHFLDISIVNSWLIYRRDCDSLGIALNDRLDLQHFKLSVGKSLLEGKLHPDGSKDCRPLQSVEKLYSLKKKHGNRTNPIPESNIRKDGLNHWPNVRDNQNRCKMPGCGMKTFVHCSKCNTYLCLTKNRNCFTKFHT